MQYIKLNLLNYLGRLMFAVHDNTFSRRRNVEWSPVNGSDKAWVLYRSSLQSLQSILCWKWRTLHDSVWHVHLQPVGLESNMLMTFNEALLYASFSEHFWDKNNTILFHLLQIKGWILQPKDEQSIWESQNCLLMKSTKCRDLMLWLSSIASPI